MHCQSKPTIFFSALRSKIYCYTDATKYIEKPVDIESIFASPSNTSGVRKTYELELEDYVGNYWCEAFAGTTIKSNKILAYRRRTSEFAVVFSFYNVYSYSCYVSEESLVDWVVPYIERVYGGKAKKVRLMEIVEVSGGGGNSCQDAIFVVHVTTKRKHPSYYETMKNLTTDLFNRTTNLTVVSFASADYCYTNNEWPTTSLGESTSSSRICISKEGVPVRRVCGGNFTRGGHWSDPDGDCADDAPIPAKTRQLHNITSNRLEANYSKTLSLLAKDTNSTTALDVYFFSRALADMFELRRDPGYLADISETIDGVMESGLAALRESQLLFNATDSVLRMCEALYEDAELLRNVTFLRIRKKNYLVQLSKPFYNNVSGVAIYGDEALNVTVDGRLPGFTDDLVLATYLPRDAIANATYENLTVITTVFFREELFVETGDSSSSVGSKVVSVTVPDQGAFLATPVPVWFRSERRGRCSFWDYGTLSQKKRGVWSDIGGYRVEANQSHVVQCEYSHLTPFALLVLTEKEVANETAFVMSLDDSDPHYAALNVITIVGTVFSIVGIALVFLTAVLFDQWRSKIGTKILLQLAFVILLEVVLTQVADMHNLKSSTACVVVGVILHYIVLSKFCWMLVFAVLQYLRFVKVLGSQPSRLLLKTAILGWGLPVLPVVVTLATFSQSYSAGNFMFCYPKGLALALGLLLPITLIVVFNLVAFVYIMYKVVSSSGKFENTNRNQKQSQMFLAILLFFMLGVPWLFGLLIELFAGTWVYYFCAYMFCITATLQGFVLFVFYILLNNEVKSKWRSLLGGSQTKQSESSTFPLKSRE